MRAVSAGRLRDRRLVDLHVSECYRRANSTIWGGLDMKYLPNIAVEVIG